MGIESDQLVYDYLSRVGDLAHQRQLPSGARRELVAGLRGEIDRQRAAAGPDSPAAVRRILGRLGTPDEVVTAAGDGSGSVPRPGPTVPDAASASGSGSGGRGLRRWIPGPRPETAATEPSASGPVPGSDTGTGSGTGSGPGTGTRPGTRGVRRWIPGPRTSANGAPAPEAPAPATPGPALGGTPPHLAGLDERGSGGQDTDWWDIAPRPFGPGEHVAGFTGGVEIPEILAPPRRDDEEAPDAPAPGLPDAPATGGPVDLTKEAAPASDEEGDAPPRRPVRRLLARLRRRPVAPADDDGAAPDTTAAAPGFHPGGVVPVLAAALLVAGAVLASWVALGIGWLLAWGFCRLSDRERKFAVLGIPGVAAAVGLLWIWGREDGRWGEPVPADGMGDALSAAAPWLIKGAAVASALFVLWRARRR
ncbi:hypothetical protein [Streptomyces yaizuensis]|uniref:DUF2157 domain-containing protein n=1 Tax=Streptomyces yaizuensis TaxID=2989713 RepID=A0ABQ5P3L4_9ACTN|nr:hypothetical protein [Streptomyces sp. YSPA8]GLF97184.1 DUF2157 domain-containing protein [Streptomyces sp. YSPA8]